MPSFRRLILVHRVLALLLVPALIATSGVAPSLHVHAYGDHDHPEHRHGLAAHEHHSTRAHPDDRTVRLEGCDPSRHTVSFAFVCSAPLQVHAAHAALALPASPTPEPQVQPGPGHADVRVHGPPPRTHASPRAPPLIAHA